MSDLAQIISRHIADAERPGDSRSDLLERYMNEPLGDEVNGRSAAQTSEVFDTVEALTAELMDLVASEDDIVTFKPDSAEDELRAKAETKACNHIYWDQNNGFEIAQAWLKSGLIEQMGYIRSGWVEEDEVSIDSYAGLTLTEALARKASYDADPDADVDLIDMDGFTEDDTLGYIPEFDDDGQPKPVSFKVRCVKSVNRYQIEAIPQNNVLISARWHKTNVQDVPFIAIEHDEYSRSDLIALGFNEDDVAKLSSEVDDENKDKRHDTDDNDDDERGSIEDATEQVIVYECWVLSDDDGDGVAERLKVWMGHTGKDILHWADGSEAKEEVDSVEISAWSPIIVPFRHNGRAASEIVDDIQAVNTTLLRQTLDGTYATLYPRPVVDERGASKHTFTDLASPDHGAPIRVRLQGSVAWPQPPAVAPLTLPMMEKMNAMREERTGVTRLNQGLDAETLNKTMGGQQMLLTQGQKRIKLIARNFGEGFRDLFVRMHRDLRRGNIKRLNFKNSGAWVEETPLEWPVRKSMSVAIGTGSGDKAEKQATLGMVLNGQREMMAAGSDMVDETKVYETIDRMVKLGGYPSASAFFIDPRSDEYKIAMANKPEPKPDPATLLAQAEMQKAIAMADKAKAEAQQKLAQIQLDAAKAKQDHEVKMLELRLKEKGIDLDETKAAAQIQTDFEAQDLAEQVASQDEAFRRDKLAVDVINAE